MGNTTNSYLGSVGRGGTSNQTGPSFQIGRARRSFQSQQAANNQRAMERNRMAGGAGTGAFLPFAMMANAGIQKSLDALRDWEDTPYGPARTYASAVERTGGNRLLGNAGRSELPDRATLRPGYGEPTGRNIGRFAQAAIMRLMDQSEQAKQARTGGDRYIQMRFNEPNYRSR